MNYKILLYSLLALFLVVGCNEDDSAIEATVYENQVRFSEEGTFEVGEASGETVRIPVVMNDYVEETVTVEFTMTGDAANYELVSPTSGTLEIPAGTRQGFIMIKPVDNFEYNDPLNSVVINITGVSGADAVMAESYNELTVVFTDNDCPAIPEGTYLAVTNSGTFPGSEYEVEITQIEPGKYQVSDITMGLYPVGYGSAENPGVFTQTSCTVTISEAESPDVVFGGDNFFGSGSFNGSDAIVLSWANNYGDNGNTTLVLQ